MSHGGEPGAATGLAHKPALALLQHSLNAINGLLLRVSMLALVLTSVVLSYSVASRYFFKSATDWQDEASVFLLVGATFLCGAYVQSYRGHIGIEALASILPPWVNRIRLVLVDLLTLVFCAFFAWKSWTLFHEAWVEHHTSSSSWAPPLSIPYGLMATGMTLLTLQVLLQAATHFLHGKGHR